MTNHKAHNAADPNWFDQAEAQMSGLYDAIQNIGDASCEEAFEALDQALDNAKRLKRYGAP